MDIMDRLKGPRRNLPIGIQSFERLRRDGYLYVDKTAFVYELASTGNPYFLSRPRRFGKSLLLSTLEAYFCGKKELFEGLAIEQLETEWNEHAVLHLDLNAEDYSEIEGLRNGLELQLRSWEKVYGTSEEGLSYSGRFMQVIKEAYRQTGITRQVPRNAHRFLYCTEISRPLVALRLYHRSDQICSNGYIQHSQPTD